jgi:glycosyltransferase involved in cell wall biosynthesis
MPVYNAEAYVSQAVESILAQSFDDFEFLIFDDGSSDRSLEILVDYTDRDNRIRVCAKPHKGHTFWLNEGVQIAQGEFIARMDADDLSLSKRFAFQVNHLHNNRDCVVVGCDLLLIDSDGDPLSRLSHHVEHDALESALLNGGFNVISHPASMMRRSALLAVGGYSEKYEPIEDFHLWLQLAELGRLSNIPEVLFHYRMHHKSVNATQFERQRILADKLLKESRERRGLRPLAYSIWSAANPTFHERHRTWAFYAVCGGYRKTAFKHINIAISRQPFSPKTWVVLILCCLPKAIVSLLKRLHRARPRLNEHQSLDQPLII